MRPGENTQAQALGQTFTRDLTETEAQFVDRIRACAQAHRQPGQYGVQVLLTNPVRLPGGP